MQIEKIIKDAPKPSDFGLDYVVYEEKKMRLSKLEKKISEARKEVLGKESDGFLSVFPAILLGGIIIGALFESLFVMGAIILILSIINWTSNINFKKRESQFNSDYRTDIEQVKDLTKYISDQKQKYNDFKSSCREYAIKVLVNFKQENLHNVRSSRPEFYTILDQFEDLVIFFKNTEPYKPSYWDNNIGEFESYISKRREGYKRSSPHQSFQNLIPKEVNRPKEGIGTQEKFSTTHRYAEHTTNQSKEAVFVEVPELKIQNSTQPIIRKPSGEINYHNDASDDRKQDIGLRGELLVLEAEKADLVAQGKSELAEKVEHVSRQGDGHGYDILSYFPNGMKKYVEVKSTTSSSHSSIVLTRNEIGVLKRKKTQAFVYLVEGVETEHPRIKACPGDMFLNTDKYLVTKYAARLN